MPHVHQNVELKNTAKDGETGIYRNSAIKHDLLATYDKNIRTLYDIWQDAYPRSRKLECIGFRPILNSLTQERSSEFLWQTYGQVAERVDYFGSGLRQLVEETTGKVAGNGPSPIGIWAINRPEWGISDLACMSFGFYTVALYDTLGSDAVRFIVNHSDLEVIICTSNHIGYLLQIQHDCPNIKLIISMDPLNDNNHGAALISWANEKGIRLHDFEHVERLGKQQQHAHTPPQATDLAVILYTSGTTGQPKGVMLTHGNFLANISSIKESFDFTFGQEGLLSFMPLAHVFERMVDWLMWANGGRVGYFSGSVDTLLEDIQLLKPTLFAAVPRLLNRIYSKLIQATIYAPGALGHVFRRAVNTKIQAMRNQQGSTHAIWDRLLFNKVKQVLGGNVRMVLTGSAPIAGEVLEFLKVALCVDIVEAYGSTENCAAATHHQVNEYRTGHVGATCLCTEIKLVDVPELNYLTTDPQPRGEICTRGLTTFLGYYKDEEKTKETIIDGWFHTGDIGMMDGNGNLVVIDRLKNIFKLAQGEYIAPEKIENVLMNDPMVMQAFVYGDSLQSSLVAVIVPDPETFLGWAKGDDMIGLCGQPKVVDALLDHIKKVAQQGGLKGFEIPKAIFLEPIPFSIESGILTPTMKLKRPEAKQRYLDQIQIMYQRLELESPKAML
ncbi:hypothetical protein BC941DRAFT_408769 [Chlamydoabsidia padenii]|nr:hypothetical protein BC941DRAFT_408769 [Chlamydoabsidia padenii]